MSRISASTEKHIDHIPFSPCLCHPPCSGPQDLQTPQSYNYRDNSLTGRVSSIALYSDQTTIANNNTPSFYPGIFPRSVIMPKAPKPHQHDRRMALEHILNINIEENAISLMSLHFKFPVSDYGSPASVWHRGFSGESSQSPQNAESLELPPSPATTTSSAYSASPKVARQRLSSMGRRRRALRRAQRNVPRKRKSLTTAERTSGYNRIWGPEQQRIVAEDLGQCTVRMRNLVMAAFNAFSESSPAKAQAITVQTGENADQRRSNKPYSPEEIQFIQFHKCDLGLEWKYIVFAFMVFFDSDRRTAQCLQSKYYRENKSFPLFGRDGNVIRDLNGEVILHAIKCREQGKVDKPPKIPVLHANGQPVYVPERTRNGSEKIEKKKVVMKPKMINVEYGPERQEIIARLLNRQKPYYNFRTRNPENAKHFIWVGETFRRTCAIEGE